MPGSRSWRPRGTVSSPGRSRDITSRQSDTLEIFPNTLREASEGVPLTAGALPPSPKASFGNAPTITDPALSDYTYTTKNFITVYNESTQPTYNHIEYTTISSMPKRSLFLSGSAVVYPYVTEYEGDEDSDYGKTVYRYTNELNELLPSQGSTYRLYSDDRLLRDNTWKSGMLLSRHVYRKTGGGYTEVRFDFSENTSSSSRSYPSVFIFDSSGSQVQFVQEGRSPQLDGISWISGRRFTSEEGRTWMTDIAYYDGLGRPEQTVEKWSTPDYGDIVTLREYDAVGRETILWNATEVGSDGLRKTPPAIRSSAIAEYGDDNPYTETVYENSAMDRVSSQWLQGEANRDAGASTEVEYGSSTADEILYGTVSDDGTLALRNAVPVFKFASDNSDVEWVVHRNDDTYTIGTKHDANTSGSWGDYGLDKPQVSMHSHPGVNSSKSQELDSMGYHDGVPGIGDWTGVITDVRANGKQTRMNYVYFPNSTRLYHVEYYGPRFIREINNDYKRFYFGTLNVR